MRPTSYGTLEIKIEISTDIKSLQADVDTAKKVLDESVKIAKKTNKFVANRLKELNSETR